MGGRGEGGDKAGRQMEMLLLSLSWASAEDTSAHTYHRLHEDGVSVVKHRP